MNAIEAVEGGVRLRVHVQPRASRTELAGLYGGALKVRVAAPPADGAANDELCRFLAAALGVAPRAVEVTGGRAARGKSVRVNGITVEHAAAALGIAPA